MGAGVAGAGFAAPDTALGAVHSLPQIRTRERSGRVNDFVFPALAKEGVKFEEKLTCRNLAGRQC